MTAQQQQSWLERSPDLQSYRKLLRQEFYAPRDLGVKSTESLASSQPKTSLIPIQQASKDSQALRLNEIHLPRWHSPWELYRVVSGHLGWVRCVALDPTNQWFSTGSTDRTIKIWDLASGQLKLTLTGHIHSVRGLAISARSPYLFSVGEDKAVKCWDLEQNKVVRNYHGHLSGVYSCALHPTLDVLATAGADSTTRVWDIRTKAAIHVLVGHTSPVAVVRCQAGEPQVITGSHDSTIRLWDLAAGKTRAVLTNHKKSVRALEFHPAQYTFVSGSPDNIKIWQCPDGTFLRNASGHDAIIQSLAVNADGVLVSGGLDGSLFFWDWETGYNFQQENSQVQPGSLESEAGIMDCTFDLTGTRLITCESDKTIKMWKENTQHASLSAFSISKLVLDS